MANKSNKPVRKPRRGTVSQAELTGKLAAIDRSQAVIEFAVDGTVLNANENFLKTVGYALDEIQGHHHGMFVDSAYRDSPEYRAFWQKLGRGDYDAGLYRRIAKGGREFWIQATYNPIFDQKGKLLKVVKFATDVTTQHHEAEMNAAFKGALDNLLSNVMVADRDLNIIYMNSAVKAMMAAAQSDIRKDLPQFDASRLLGANIDAFHKDPSHQRAMLAGLTKSASPELVLGGRTLRVLMNPMLDPNGKRLGTVVEWTDRTAELAVEREMRDIVAAVAAGDLDQRLKIEGKSAFFEELARGINALADNMTLIVSRVKAVAGEVTRGADEISHGNADLSQRTEEQASSLEETASSMEQMTSTVKQNADNASQANQLAVAARDQAEKGGAVVARAVKAMTDINDSSAKIADIIGVIDEIAFQTNLLALNAAVEAARAGEQGRGFAVVASEVRNLAGRSATAAKQIKSLIQDSVKKVEEGSLLVAQSGATLEQIVAAVKKVSDIVGEIAAASQEQSSGIEQVNKAVMQLDEMTQQNAALVEEASAASQSMADQARRLDTMMAQYHIAQGAADAALRELSTETQSEAATGSRSPERRAPQRPWSKNDPRPAAPRAVTTPPPRRPALATGTAATAAVDTDWKQF